MATSIKELRLRRIRFNVRQREMAERLGCSVGWVFTLEKPGYRGPAQSIWVERYRQNLDEIIAERKAQRAKT